MSALEISDLHFAFGGSSELLSGVDFRVEAGEFAVLLGPNGVGKSTLLKLGAGLLNATAGSVQIAGAPIHTMRADERARRVALIPQGLNRWPEISVRQFVASGRYAHRATATEADDRLAIESALERAVLQDLAASRLDRLSGGQRQRALVARALAQAAPIFLVDEPTAGLDPEHQLRVLDVLAQEAAAGALVLVATHELHLAVQYAERLLVLNRGELVADGPLAEVLAGDALSDTFGSRLTLGRWATAQGERALPLPERDAR